MTKVIRNTERATRKEAPSTRYVPEYVRLKRTPLVRDASELEAVEYPPQSRIPLHTGATGENQWMGQAAEEENDIVTFDGHVSEDFSDTENVSNSSNDDQYARYADDNEQDVSNIQPGEYILMVSAIVVCSGSREKVTERINQIVYGKDPAFAGRDLEPEDFIVLQRQAISFGVRIG